MKRKPEKKTWELAMHCQRWTPKEEALLRKLYPTMFNHELEEHFGRRARNIGLRARKMGIKKGWMNHDLSRFHKGKPWSKKEVKRLKRLFPVMPTPQLLVHFPKRSAISITGKAKALGLRKNYLNLDHRPHGQLPAKLRIWSTKDIKKTRTLWQQGYNKKEIARIIGKNLESVSAQIFRQTRDFGLQKRRDYKWWSQEETAYLIKHYKDTSTSRLSEILGREKHMIRWKAQTLKLTAPASKPWTAEEINFVKKYYKQWTNPQIAEKLGRSVSAIDGKAKSLNLRNPAFQPWTTEEMDFIKKYYKQWTYAQIAKKLGRTREAAMTRALQMGLKKR